MVRPQHGSNGAAGSFDPYTSVYTFAFPACDAVSGLSCMLSCHSIGGASVVQMTEIATTGGLSRVFKALARERLEFLGVQKIWRREYASRVHLSLPRPKSNGDTCE